LFFTKYIYADILPATFPYKLTIADDLRKKMGKKSRKNKKCHKKNTFYIIFILNQRQPPGF
jgi:hypothetical protein